MNPVERFNEALNYIESNLCAEFELDEVSRIACVTSDSFMRFFSYMAGITLKEYIRKRRLTKAAYDLKNQNERIIDIAVKYGYNSADSFSRAFKKQHGINPSEYRENGGRLNVFLPASFQIYIQGAKEMNFRIINLKETELYGMSMQYEGMAYPERETLRNLMWTDRLEDIPGRICPGEWNHPTNRAHDGVWYGLWHNGRYMIAREKDKVKSIELEKIVLPEGLYASFTSEPGRNAWDEIPKLRDTMFNLWLPDSEYKHKGDLVIEVEHLWTDYEMRKNNKYYELWIPIEIK